MRKILLYSINLILILSMLLVACQSAIEEPIDEYPTIEEPAIEAPTVEESPISELVCPQQPTADELETRNNILITRAYELFPPYDDFSPEVYEHIDGLIIPYRLFEPTKENGELYPMVVFLHGGGAIGTDNISQIKDEKVPATVWAFPENQAKYPSYVLLPQGTDRPAWPQSKIQAFKALLDSLLANNPIDPNRIYITGLSMGGNGTWAIIQEYPDFFAAAVPVCGGGDMDKLDGIIDNNLPIWAFHGELDPIVDIDAFTDHLGEEDAFTGQRQLVQELIKLEMEPSPRYTWYPDVLHNSWVGAYSDPLLIDWLFSQRKD